MNWLPELLKNISVSKSVAGALFIATACMLILPGLFPTQFPAVPNEWRWLVGGLSFFSGALLALWCISGAWKIIAKTPAALRKAMPERELTNLECSLLALIGINDPNGAVNLGNLDQSRILKLEMFQMCKGLESLGFVELNPWHNELVSLTDKGRARALLILRQAKA